MHKTLFFLAILLGAISSNSSMAQEFRITKQSEGTLKKIKASESVYTISPEFDTTRATPVAIAELTTPGVTLEKLYDRAVDEARGLGANGLRLAYLDENYRTCRLEFYHLSDDAIETNLVYAPKNTLFVFAGEKFDSPNYYTFECNGVSRSVKNGTYFTYVLKEGEQIKLKKGTVAGTITWVKWRSDGNSSYFSIHGFYKEPVVKRTTQSPSVKPGKFHSLGSEFGKFLVQALAPGIEQK